MKCLGEKPFHTFLLLTEKPAQWRAWQLLPVAAVLVTSAGLIWVGATGVQTLGWFVALGLLFFALADWALLAILPRQGVSFGPVQPPWLALTFLRWLVALAVSPLAIRWPFPALLTLAVLQVLVWVLALYGTVVEPFRLQVTHVEIASAKLPNPGRPLRVVQLSDLHIERLTRRERALPSLVAQLDPDLIVLTGDFLSTTYNQDLRALDDLQALLKQFRAPSGIFAVWGTAEVDLPDLLRPLLAGLDIRPLEDEAIEVIAHGSRLWLMGLNCTGDLTVEGARLRELVAAAPPESFTLLLYHMPDLMPQAADLGVDLFLAGHTHGGQWRVPGFGAILTSSRYWKRYEAGGYREGHTHLYVSRGLGLEGFGAPRARFFCPPEIVLITITGKGEGG